MKIKLHITKDGTSLYSGVYDVVDADSFGKACTDAWSKLEQERLDRESSIGALMEHLEDDALDQLIGAHLVIEKA